MLKNILKNSECASCRVCCVFDRTDVWEIPLFDNKTKDRITEMFGNKVIISERNGGYVMKPEFKEGEELTYCPALGENGCTLGEFKPFDCKIWPFRVMEISDGVLGITVSPVCETVSSRSVSEISEFLLSDNENFSEKIFSYADTHPYIIKPYIDNYPIFKIKIKEENN